MTKFTSTTTTMRDKTMAGIGNLIKILPTGTVFLYQFLNPVLTNNGKCHVINKYLSGALIAICGFSCCFSFFTDSYIDSNGIPRYVIATLKGFWPASQYTQVDASAYKLQFGDFVHSLLSLLVFAMIALLDTNTVRCFYPSFEASEKVLLMVLPPVLGTVASTAFAIFPNKRHGIGYPSSQSTDQASRTRDEANLMSDT